MGFVFAGESPAFGPNDTITPVDEIRMHDIVTFVEANPGEYHIHVVKSSEYSTFRGVMYQIDRAPDQPGIFKLTQVKIQFWPWDDVDHN